MVCSNALKRTIKNNLRSPSDILNKTRELFTEAFAKSGKLVHDGMDIALCYINHITLYVTQVRTIPYDSF